MRLIIYTIVALYVFFQSSEYFYSTHEYEDKEADSRALNTTALACALLYCLFWIMNQVSGASGTIGDSIVLVFVLVIIVIHSVRKRQISEWEEVYQNEADGKKTRICPQCGESILAIAIKCRYCGGDLVEVESVPAPGEVVPDQRINQKDLVNDNGEESNQPDTITREKKKCPNCGEKILTIAIMCPYCGQSLRETGETKVSYPEPVDHIRTSKIQKRNISEWEEIYLKEAYGKETRTCPFCGETILALADMCRYCGQDLTEPRPILSPEPTESAEITNEADVVLDMDNPGLAADPESVPVDEADRRAAVWVAGTLVVMSALAILAYLITK